MNNTRDERTVYGYPPPARTTRNSNTFTSQLTRPTGQYRVLKAPTPPNNKRPRIVIANFKQQEAPSPPKIKRPRLVIATFEQKARDPNFGVMSTKDSAERDLHLPPAPLSDPPELPPICHMIPESSHNHYRALRAQHRDMVTLIVSTSQVECQHPREVLESTSHFLRRLLHPTGSSSQPIPLEGLSLPAFYDYGQWLYSARILPFHHHHRHYAIEAHAHRLVEALRLGVELESDAYQASVMWELFHLGPYIDVPEEYIDGIFAFAGHVAWRDGSGLETWPHPARWLIVAIVAAKREGRGRGALVYERFREREFCRMFGKWFVRKSRGRSDAGCGYPKDLEEVCRGA